MSDQPDNGGPAFPTVAGNMVYSNGMSLRDWFAGQALAALINKAPFFDAQGEHGNAVDLIEFKSDMAVSAYFYADAMLAARGAK